MSVQYNVEELRKEFPILSEIVHGKPLVYLDNAATTQKPQSVIETLVHYYTHDNANIHRGVHLLSQRSTDKYEATRTKIKQFLNARSTKEIIFVRGATEGINLVAQTYGRANLKPGDEIIISGMEHHSNIVPWQILCEQTGAVLKVVPLNDDGELIIDAYDRLLSSRTKIVSIVHMSNALGTINPVKQIIEKAHAIGAVTLIDGAQAVSHIQVDVQDLDCDFYVFSGHKIYGPTGIGALYGKAELLDKMPPYQGGGDMIATVTFDKSTYAALPAKLEAGTPNIAGGIGLGTAIDFVNRVGLQNIAAYEAELLTYATDLLTRVSGLKIIGTAKNKASVISFVLDGVHPHDIGTILDQEGVAVRTGHHCTQPVMQRYEIPATARASLACYNTHSEIDALANSIQRVAEVFG